MDPGKDRNKRRIGGVVAGLVMAALLAGGTGCNPEDPSDPKAPPVVPTPPPPSPQTPPRATLPAAVVLLPG